MKFKTEKIQDKLVGKWYITIDGIEWSNYVKKAEKKVADRLEIPGFRKGKIPAYLLKKYLTEPKILFAAHNLVVNKAYQFAFDQKSDIEPFSSPVLSVKNISRIEYVLQLKFYLKPEFKISKYTGFTSEHLKRKKIEVKKDDIDNNINQLRNRFAVFKPKTTGIVKGDIVVLDFEGFVNGKSLKGGKAEDFTLKVGSGQLIPGFEEKMINFKTGDEKEINVTFPPDYHVEELKSIPAVFKLKIKKVKIKELPELNDELAKNVGLKEIDTLAKLEAHVKNNIYKQLLKQEYNHFVGNLFRLIAENAKISLPESIISNEANKLKHEFEQKLQEQQLDIKIYKKRTGMSEENIFEELFKDAKNRLENGVIINAVIQNEKITATETEINKQYEELKTQFKIDGKALKKIKSVSNQQIREQIIHDKVFFFLYENNGE